MRIQRVNEIGNMISIEDQKSAILDAMSRCTEGGTVWNTYDAVLTMLTTLSNEYDAEIFVDSIKEEVELFDCSIPMPPKLERNDVLSWGKGRTLVESIEKKLMRNLN